mgnify:CR=1 FL=1
MADREFPSGATRDKDEGKFDYEGFLHPLVLMRFAAYMHKSRHRPDGSFRDSDNWKRGIPRAAYMKSKMRHDMDLWLHHSGLPRHATESAEDACCAIMFNVMGYLLELMRGTPTPDEPSRPGTPDDGGHHATERPDDGLTEEPSFPYVEIWHEGVRYYIANRRILTSDETEHLPLLDRELNYVEYAATPSHYRPMYYWDVPAQKWLLHAQYQDDWGRS